MGVAPGRTGPGQGFGGVVVGGVARRERGQGVVDVLLADGGAAVLDARTTSGVLVDERFVSAGEFFAVVGGYADFGAPFQLGDTGPRCQTGFDI